MSHRWLLLSICLTIFISQISFLNSISINTGTTSQNIDENNGTQRVKNALNQLIKNTLEETNIYKQAILLNQLREYLNRMCVVGYFGSVNARSCQRIVDTIHQLDDDEEYNDTFLDDHTNNEDHGIQKRFFCNGFIGCKNLGR